MPGIASIANSALLTFRRVKSNVSLGLIIIFSDRFPVLRYKNMDYVVLSTLSAEDDLVDRITFSYDIACQ